MQVVPIAYDSMGVRSMATFVKTDKKIFIDPGVALGPKRYGLSPSGYEITALNFFRKKIIEIASKCDIIFVSHYHYDHHPFPSDGEMYEIFRDKIVIAKDIRKNIHKSGERRGKIFEEKVREIAKELIWGDNRSFSFGKTKMEVSEAVWHGEVESKVGKVIMVCIEEKDEKLVFGSDAQLLADESARKWVLSKNPDFLIVDGYPTIFLGWRMSKEKFEKAKREFKKVVERVRAKIIFDHHGVRDVNFREKMENFWGKEIKTAAEFLGIDNLFLEAWRKEIYEGKKIEIERYFKDYESALNSKDIRVF